MFKKVFFYSLSYLCSGTLSPNTYIILVTPYMINKLLDMLFTFLCVYFIFCRPMTHDK